MTRWALSVLLALAASPALAGGVTVNVADSMGVPVAGAVVELVSDTPLKLPASRLPGEATIDQRDETFIPLVSLIRAGGIVVFTNNDTTRHQVYSFSPIKQFEFEIDRGQRSDAVRFDKPGVASIGCNIHDQMITYVYVSESPFAALTDAKGRVEFSDVPAGAWHAHVWHPRLVPGRPAPSQAFVLSGPSAQLSVETPLMTVSTSGMKHMHMGKY